MNSWDFALKVLQVLLWCGTSFYVYMSNKDKVTNDRITKLESDIDDKSDDHSERIAKLEARIEKSPTHDDLFRFQEKINEVSKCVNRLEGEFIGASKTLQLIHETLMERK